MGVDYENEAIFVAMQDEPWSLLHRAAYRDKLLEAGEDKLAEVFAHMDGIIFAALARNLILVPIPIEEYVTGDGGGYNAKVLRGVRLDLFYGNRLLLSREVRLQ